MFEKKTWLSGRPVDLIIEWQHVSGFKVYLFNSLFDFVFQICHAHPGSLVSIHGNHVVHSEAQEMTRRFCGIMRLEYTQIRNKIVDLI